MYVIGLAYKYYHMFNFHDIFMTSEERALRSSSYSLVLSFEWSGILLEHYTWRLRNYLLYDITPGL